MGVFWVGERRKKEEEGGKGALGRLLIYLAAAVVVLLVPWSVHGGGLFDEREGHWTHTCLSLPVSQAGLPVSAAAALPTWA